MYQARPPPGSRPQPKQDASPYRILKSGNCVDEGLFYIETSQECRIAATQLKIAQMTELNWPDKKTINGKWPMSMQLRSKQYSAALKMGLENAHFAGLMDETGKKNFQNEKKRIFQPIDEDNRIFWDLQPFCGTENEDAVLTFNWLGLFEGISELQGSPSWRRILPIATKDKWQICRTTGGPARGGRIVAEWKEVVTPADAGGAGAGVSDDDGGDVSDDVGAIPIAKNLISGLSYGEVVSHAKSKDGVLLECPELKIYLRNMAVQTGVAAFDVRVNQPSSQWVPCRNKKKVRRDNNVESLWIRVFPHRIICLLKNHHLHLSIHPSISPNKTRL